MRKLAIVVLALLAAPLAAGMYDAGGRVPGQYIGVVQPTRSADMTLNATSGWAYVYLSCTASPCDCTIWNPSTSTISWILEGTTTTPGISGAPLLANGVLNVPYGNGMNYLWFTATGTATGYAQPHY